LLKDWPTFGCGAADDAGVDAAAAAAAAAAAPPIAAAPATECLPLACRWDNAASPLPAPNFSEAAAAAEIAREKVEG